jgi:hypothetical protein
MPKSQARLQKLSNDLDNATDSLCNPMRVPTNTDGDKYTSVTQRVRVSDSVQKLSGNKRG